MENLVGEYIIKKGYIASSPSSAAAIVMGRSANGLVEWKLENGITLKDHESTLEE